jgi:hypothetical protein
MTPITIRFEEDERKALTAATKRTGLSAGAIVRLLVREYAGGVRLQLGAARPRKVMPKRGRR